MCTYEHAVHTILHTVHNNNILVGSVHTYTVQYCTKYNVHTVHAVQSVPYRIGPKGNINDKIHDMDNTRHVNTIN